MSEGGVVQQQQRRFDGGEKIHVNALLYVLKIH
jgi:hypothetical protein